MGKGNRLSGLGVSLSLGDLLPKAKSSTLNYR